MSVAMKRTKKEFTPRSAAKLSTLDDFLKEQGKLETFKAVAIKEVLARRKLGRKRS